MKRTVFKALHMDPILPKDEDKKPYLNANKSWQINLLKSNRSVYRSRLSSNGQYTTSNTTPYTNV